RGLLVINAPKAQGLSGNLKAAGPTQLGSLKISCDLDLAHIIAVTLDDQPLKTSRRILLQVMSEEQNSGFATEAVDATTRRISNIGHDPWQVKQLNGVVEF